MRSLSDSDRARRRVSSGVSSRGDGDGDGDGDGGGDGERWWCVCLVVSVERAALRVDAGACEWWM